MHFAAPEGNLHFAKGDVASLARAVRRYASGAAAAEAAEGGLEVEDRRQYFTEEESLLVAMPLLLAAMPLLLVASSL